MTFCLPRSLHFACSLLLVMAVAPALGQSYLFNRADFGAGKAPSSVATGDFRGIGKLDIVVANRDSNTISIFFGNAGGTFQPRVDYAVLVSPLSVAVGDLNHDGKLDIVVADRGSSEISVFLGNGDGTFRARVDYATGNGPWQVLLGDFNNDGKLDAAVLDTGTNTISVLLGNGDGTFRPHVDSVAAATPDRQAMAAGFFNADGKLDLAVAAQGGVSILLGNGDGTFQPPVEYATNNLGIAVVAGDLNHDGKQDLAVATLGGVISVLLGNGDGSFQAHVDYPLNSARPSSIATADLNRDGALDLVVTYESGTLANQILVMYGHGDGTFNYRNQFLGSGSTPASVAVGDFTGDGFLDLVSANQGSNNISVLVNDGRTFSPRIDAPVFCCARSITTADFNRDGKPDLAVSPLQGNVAVLLANASGGFQSPAYVTGSALTFVVASDFNGDGKPDLAGTTPSAGLVSIRLGNGDGTFQPEVRYATGSGPWGIAEGDFNGDGKLDLAIANNVGNTVSILLGNGDGTFQPHVDYASGSGGPPAPYAILAADFNHDGILDLAVTNIDSGTVSVLLGKGDGTFGPFIEHLVGGNPYSLATGDFNGDGRLDLAVSFQKGGGLVLVGNGDGTFTTGQSLSTMSGAITAGDFNADGKVDLAVSSAPGLSVFLGNGDATFQLPMQYDGSGGDSTITADLNGDGSPDIASDLGSVFLTTPVAAVYPSGLAFGNQKVGTGSTPRMVTFTNSGTAPLLIGDITLSSSNSADFTQDSSCDSSLSPRESCTITITFKPSAAGFRFAYLSITDNAQFQLQQISLTGNGTP